MLKSMSKAMGGIFSNGMFLLMRALVIFGVQGASGWSPLNSPLADSTAPPQVLDLTSPQPISFSEGFAETPSSPQALSSSNWHVSIQIEGGGEQVTPIQADYGSGCEGMPLAHAVSHVDELAYQCSGRLITTIAPGGGASDHGMLYFSPNQLLDFTEDVSMTWEMSTLRSNPLNDWVEIWITPIDDAVMSPATKWVQAGQGLPENGLLLRLDGGNNWVIQHVVDHEIQVISTRLRPYETVLTPSKYTLAAYEFSITNGRLRFGLPNEELWWLETKLPPDMREWDQVVVQFGIHSTGESVGCSDPTCRTNSWHWDNVSLFPSQPFTMIGGDQRAIDASSSSKLWTLASTTTSNGTLRFSGIGQNLEVSFDNGTTWVSAQLHGQLERYHEMRSYTVSVPSGTSTILFRGQSDWTGDWAVRDMTIWTDLP